MVYTKESNAARTIAPIKYEDKPREAPKQVELEHLRMAYQTPKERAIIELLYSTGCRVSELSVVKRADIDWNAKSVHLFGKGRNHRVIFLGNKCHKHKNRENKASTPCSRGLLAIIQFLIDKIIRF